MRIRRDIVAGSLVLIGLGFYGCDGNDVEVAQEEIQAIQGVVAEPVSELAEFKFHNLMANIPSPLVTYNILQESGAPYYKELSNPLETRSRYTLESSKGQNFGVYMADFGYALLNNDNQKALKYYAAAHDLANDLGFGAVLDAVVNERLVTNFGNTDSAKVLINDAYRAVDTYLRSNDQLKTAGYMLTGGWMQTQYIVLSMLEGSESETVVNHLRGEVYKQQLNIANLTSFLVEYQSDPHVASLIEELATVKGAYDLLVDAMDVEGGKLEGLKVAISTLRSKIINRL